MKACLQVQTSENYQVVYCLNIWEPTQYSATLLTFQPFNDSFVIQFWSRTELFLFSTWCSRIWEVNIKEWKSKNEIISFLSGCKYYCASLKTQKWSIKTQQSYNSSKGFLFFQKSSDFVHEGRKTGFQSMFLHNLQRIRKIPLNLHVYLFLMLNHWWSL